MFRTHLILGVVLGSSMIAGGCAKKDEIDCGPADQREAFMPRIPGDGIARVVVDSSFGDESSAEFQAIQAATTTWNQHANSALGHPFFKLETSPVPRFGGGPSAKDDCDGVDGNGNMFLIVRDNSDASREDSRWSSMGLNSNNPGVTLRCYDGDSRLQKQVVLINTRITSKHQKQFGSIVVHELGHAIGLDHSCTDKQGSEGYRSCNELPESHDYRMAVMFPSLRVGGSSLSPFVETKEEIRANDQERANCRYKE